MPVEVEQRGLPEDRERNATDYTQEKEGKKIYFQPALVPPVHFPPPKRERTEGHCSCVPTYNPGFSHCGQSGESVLYSESGLAVQYMRKKRQHDQLVWLQRD